MSNHGLGGWRAFATVARRGSFVEAARQLDTSTASVSRRVRALEEHLGIQLVLRTTRQVKLTEAGLDCLHAAEQLLNDHEVLEAKARRRNLDAYGVLRVGVDMSAAQELLVPLLGEFLERYPQVELRLLPDDRRVSLLDAGLDLSVRIGPLADSTLRSLRLGRVEHFVCVSPGWGAQTKWPEDPLELSSLPAIVDAQMSSSWSLRGDDGETVEVEPAIRMSLAGAHAIRSAVIRGMGIALCPEFAVRADLAAGRLVRLLPRWRGPSLPLTVVFPGDRPPSAKTRAFIDFLESTLSTPAEKTSPPKRAERGESAPAYRLR